MEAAEYSENNNNNSHNWKVLADKISKNVLDSKKLVNKGGNYSPPRIRDPPGFEEKQIHPEQIRKPKPSFITQHDYMDNKETKNFDMASYIISVVLESEKNNIVLY